MSAPIIYVDQSEVRPGKLGELKSALKELLEFAEANEPRLLAYSAYFADDGTRMTVVHIHPDEASLEFHMQVAGSRFANFTELVSLSRIDIYGNVGGGLVEGLRKKAELLGDGTVHVHQLAEGFARF